VFDVCVDERYPEWDAISLLESLVEKSLVVVESTEIETRYRLLESTREFALSRLKESTEEAEVVVERHARFYLEESSRAFESFWDTNDQEWVAALQPDLGNYREAIETSLRKKSDEAAAVTLVANLTPARLYEIEELLSRVATIPSSELPPDVNGRLQLARAWRGGNRQDESAFECASLAVELLSSTDHRALLAEARGRLGNALLRMGRVEDAVAQGEPALEVAREVGFARLVAWAASQLALFVAAKGDTQRGIALHEEAAELLRSLDDRGRLRGTLINMAEVQFAGGDAEGALESVNEALALALETGGVEHSVMICHVNAASYLLALGRFAEACERARAAVEIGVRIKRGFVVAIAVGHLGEISAAFGDYERAARLIGYVDALYATRGIVREPTEAFARDAAMQSIAAAMPQERCTALLEEGSKLSQDAAVRLAMEFTLPTAAA
jgi:tetratricopeptide (TPR) repeat protein